jgi:hypothetical protein
MVLLDVPESSANWLWLSPRLVWNIFRSELTIGNLTGINFSRRFRAIFLCTLGWYTSCVLHNNV